MIGCLDYCQSYLRANHLQLLHTFCCRRQLSHRSRHQKCRSPFPSLNFSHCTPGQFFSLWYYGNIMQENQHYMVKNQHRYIYMCNSLIAHPSRTQTFHIALLVLNPVSGPKMDRQILWYPILCNTWFPSQVQKCPPPVEAQRSAQACWLSTTWRRIFSVAEL